MKYLEFYSVTVNNKQHLLKDQDEIYEYWKDEDTQKYALYSGGTKIFEKEDFLDLKENFILSDSASDMVNTIFNKDQNENDGRN